MVNQGQNSDMGREYQKHPKQSDTFYGRPLKSNDDLTQFQKFEKKLHKWYVPTLLGISRTYYLIGNNVFIARRRLASKKKHVARTAVCGGGAYA